MNLIWYIYELLNIINIIIKLSIYIINLLKHQRRKIKEKSNNIW